MTLARVQLAEQAAGRFDSEDFGEILALARRMLRLALAGEWDEVAILQDHRQQMLQRFFATPVEPKRAETVAEGIREMLEIDRLLIDEGRRCREALSDSLQKFRQGAEGVSAYRQYL